MSFLFKSGVLTFEKMYICLEMWSGLLSTTIPSPTHFPVNNIIFFFSVSE